MSTPFIRNLLCRVPKSTQGHPAHDCPWNEQLHYPDVQVQLSGEDGNAFAILGRTAAALRAAGVPKDEIDEYFAEGTSGDYDHLLQTTMRWVDWA